MRTMKSDISLERHRVNYIVEDQELIQFFNNLEICFTQSN